VFPRCEGYADGVTESQRTEGLVGPGRRELDPRDSHAGSPDRPDGPTGGTAVEPAPLEPLAWSSARIVLGGLALWAVALVVTLAVPALHTGDRDWWPWCCVAGLALGSLGYAYMRRGRGNAAGAL
jgi:hypothetical protein